MTYRDVIRVLRRQRRWFTRPEKKIVDHLIEYLDYKLTRTGLNYEVPKCKAGLASASKAEGDCGG